MTWLEPRGKHQRSHEPAGIGEDPETIEAEMGDLLDGKEDPFVMPSKKAKDAVRRRPPPTRNQTLYEL